MVEFDISDLHVTTQSRKRYYSHITKFFGRFRWYSVLGILEFYQQILITFPSIKFYEYPPSRYIMGLICAFRNFANAAKNWYQWRKKDFRTNILYAQYTRRLLTLSKFCFRVPFYLNPTYFRNNVYYRTPYVTSWGPKTFGFGIFMTTVQDTQYSIEVYFI